MAKWEDLGKGFIKTDQWIETLYADITKKTDGGVGYQNHGHLGEKVAPGGARQ